MLVSGRRGSLQGLHGLHLRQRPAPGQPPAGQPAVPQGEENDVTAAAEVTGTPSFSALPAFNSSPSTPAEPPQPCPAPQEEVWCAWPGRCVTGTRHGDVSRGRVMGMHHGDVPWGCATGTCHGDVSRGRATGTAPAAAHGQLSLPVMPCGLMAQPGPGTAQAGSHPVRPAALPFPPAGFSSLTLLLSHFSRPAVEVLLRRSELLEHQPAPPCGSPGTAAPSAARPRDFCGVRHL